MNVRKVIRFLTPATITVPLLLAASLSWSQGEQVLSEVGAMGHVENGNQGIVRPDFADNEPGDYVNWVAVAEHNFKSFAISPGGTALVLDGTTIREFKASGEEKIGSVFPRDCTTLPFLAKPGGPTTNLSSCSAITPLNDGTIRIAGQAKGGAVIIGYPEPAATARKASGLPSITDMDGDEFADADMRKGAGYWAVGDGKKIIFFPLNPAGSEQNYSVVAMLNGVDGVTPFGSGRVIVALRSGELRAVDTATGSTSPFGPLLPTGADCGLGKKDPQKFSLRGDPSGVLFVGNMGCRTITIFDGAEVPITEDPLVLNTPDLFSVEALDWVSGQSGDFAGCKGLSDTEDNVCKFGEQEKQAVLWDVKTIPGTDTSYRMFQFDLVDCRWTDDACPVLNCPGNDSSDKTKCALDLAPLLIAADQTGAFENLAFGDGPVPVMAIPAYMRGEECYPQPLYNELDTTTPPLETYTCKPNNYRFHTFFAITDALFTGTFFTDYKIDEFREPPMPPDEPGSFDPCVIPVSESHIERINETANLIVYNSDSFDTVSMAEGGRGGVIINDACNGQAGGYRWSAQSVGLELYDDENPKAYVDQANRMMQELIQAKDELLCSAFPDPDGGPDLGPLLLAADCTMIGDELSQMEAKQGTCFDSLNAPQSGNSEENCTAFFTKVQNLQNVLDAAAWPDPFDPGSLSVLRPNYEGEFRARLATLVFFIQSYVFNSVPPGGFLP
jgi:hypothetical protein